MALIDLGMVARISPGMQNMLLRLTLAISEGKSEDAVELKCAIRQTSINADYSCGLGSVKREHLKQLPMRENQRCFGCGPTNESGLRMRFHTDGEALFSWLSVPGHLSGWGEMAHGGVITTILDEIMGWSAMYLLKTLVLTKSISVDFLKPVYVGRELRAEGRVREIKGKREAVMEGFLFDADETLCSRANATFALFPPDMAAKLGMPDESIREDFERLTSI